jgi:hypothetical protein
MTTFAPQYRRVTHGPAQAVPIRDRVRPNRKGAENVTFDHKRFWHEVAGAQARNPGWRIGQAVYGTAFNLHQGQATKFCAGPLDPFYDDSKIGAFMYALIVEVESYGIHLTVVQEAQ